MCRIPYSIPKCFTEKSQTEENNTKSSRQSTESESVPIRDTKDILSDSSSGVSPVKKAKISKGVYL